MRTTRAVVIGAGLIVCAAALVGCAPVTSRVCVPELSVTPEDPKPGRIVTVETVRACPTASDTLWRVRIQPEGKSIPLAEARVTPDADGSFSVSITVPPTIAPGAAIASIANYWDTQECPEGASCAPAQVSFTVAEP